VPVPSAWTSSVRSTAFDGDYYPLALLPEHDASYLSSVRTSEDSPSTHSVE
jgi:hypothetical protein